MANFDADTLDELRPLQEVAIRTEKHPGTAVVIWVVVADEEVFVRSVRGSKGRWYRDLAVGGPATLEFAGRRLAVQAIPATDPAPFGRDTREYLRKNLSRAPYGAMLRARSPAKNAAAPTAMTGRARAGSIRSLRRWFTTSATELDSLVAARDPALPARKRVDCPSQMRERNNGNQTKRFTALRQGTSGLFHGHGPH